MIGRLFHYSFDALLVSTILAGVRQNSNRALDPNAFGLAEGTPASIANQYLGIGETIFNVISSAAVTSSYFRKQSTPPK